MSDDKGFPAFIVPLPEKLPDYPPGFVPHPDHSLPGAESGTKPGASEELPPMLTQPIVIPGDPQHPIAEPPGTIWPKPPAIAGQLPARGAENGLVLVYLPGVGWSWVVVGSEEPGAQPKR